MVPGRLSRAEVVVEDDGTTNIPYRLRLVDDYGKMIADFVPTNTNNMPPKMKLSLMREVAKRINGNAV